MEERGKVVKRTERNKKLNQKQVKQKKLQGQKGGRIETELETNIVNTKKQRRESETNPKTKKEIERGTDINTNSQTEM